MAFKKSASWYAIQMQKLFCLKLRSRAHLRSTVEAMMGTGGKDERAVGL